MTIENQITEKLTKNFKPTHLEVINESHMHSVPENSETHFRVVVVSELFDSKSRVAQHQMINKTLSHELNNGVHALAIVTRTPESWNKKRRLVSLLNVLVKCKL